MAPVMSRWPRGSNISVRRTSSACRAIHAVLSRMERPRGDGAPPVRRRNGAPPQCASTVVNWATKIEFISSGGHVPLIEPGKESAGVHPEGSGRHTPPALRLRRTAGGSVLLSEGRHAGLHEGGVRVPRPACRGSRPSKAAVLGVSILDEASKAKFATKYDLTFPLLADADHEVADKYGVWQKRSLYGRSFMGIARTTYLIDADGKVAQALGQGQGRRPRRGSARGRQACRRSTAHRSVELSLETRRRALVDVARCRCSGCASASPPRRARPGSRPAS